MPGERATLALVHRAIPRAGYDFGRRRRFAKSDDRDGAKRCFTLRAWERMTTSRTELARLLAGQPTVEQLDAALRAGKLAVKAETRILLMTGLAKIEEQLARQSQPDLRKAFSNIVKALDVFKQAAFENKGGRQAVWIMEKQAVWSQPINVSEQFSELYKTAHLYSQLYRHGKPNIVRPRVRQDWLYFELYCLYAKVKGALPGNAGPLYRFTKACAEIMGLKLRIGEDAFRMRVQRLLKELRNRSQPTIGSLASVYEQINDSK
jgi:hypothetical protein